MPKQHGKSGPSKVVNFRLAPRLQEALEELAKGHTDELGHPLSANTLARKFVVEALRAETPPQEESVVAEAASESKK